MLDSAAVSLQVGSPVADNGWSDEQVALIVGLHDIGKADSAFQHKDPPGFSEELIAAGFHRTADPPCRHERISASFVRKTLLSYDLDRRLARTISTCLLAHHGYWDEECRSVSPVYQEAQESLLLLLNRVIPSSPFPRERPEDLSAFGMKVAGHIVLCDWIASNEGFISDPRLAGLDEPEQYLVSAADVARDWVDRLGFHAGSERRTGQPSLIVSHPRPVQQTLLDHVMPPGLVVIEAPMGEGKTEAAWILAEQWCEEGYAGMYMALPTMATSNSLFDRYRDDYLGRLERDSRVRLVHGMAWLRDESEPETRQVDGGDDDPTIASTWFRPTRRAFLGEHGVGTVDQAMLAGMNVRFGFLRLHGLVRRILVIDEVHAYDSYMSAIICRLLEWCSCLGIPVILLSATLSAEQRTDMMRAYGCCVSTPGIDAPYPLISSVSLSGELSTYGAEASSTKRLRIETHEGLLGDASGTARLAESLIDNGGCCCVILNTVRQAQAVYRSLSLPCQEKILFHARYSACDRERIAKGVSRFFGRDRSTRPGRCVLVATQVVEQSLDVDFDFMVSEIAPVDLLLQRSGRMHRHSTRETDPVLHVLTPSVGSVDFGSTRYVYQDKPLMRTLALLWNMDSVSLPCDFRPLIEQCYGKAEWSQDAVPWEAIRKADVEWDAKAASLAEAARSFILARPDSGSFRPVYNEPVGDDEDDGQGWRAKTRLGASDRIALLLEGNLSEELTRGTISMDQVRDTYRRTVKLPGYLPLFRPTDGYASAVVGSGRLKGLILLPLSADGSWRGSDGCGRTYSVRYDVELGLIAGRTE